MSELSYELCFHCRSATGKAGAGDGSLYFGMIGPWCADCYAEIVDSIESEVQEISERLAAAEARGDKYLQALVHIEHTANLAVLLTEAKEVGE